jgi:hypothetical protein
MGRLLTLGHFHRITALLAKVGQQPLQPLGGEIVTPGMGYHRLTARMMNDINRLFYCTPLRRHVTGFPAGKVFLKTSAMFFAWPASTRKRAKWPRVTAPPSASRSAPSQAPGIRAFSRRSAIIWPRCWRRAFCSSSSGHRRVRNINIQTHNMNLVILPEGGNLDAVHQRQG